MTASRETLAQRLQLGPLTPREATQLCRALLSVIEARSPAHGAITADSIVLEQGRPTLLPGGGSDPSTSPEADLFAIASVLYQSVTGRQWVAGTDPAAADWSGVPRPLRRVLMRALSPTPGRRWQDPAAFQRALWVPRPSHRIWPAVVVILLAAAIILAFALCKPLGLCWQR
jgi:hypothetical protein